VLALLVDRDGLLAALALDAGIGVLGSSDGTFQGTFTSLG
jgi:hypothetical protein